MKSQRLEPTRQPLAKELRYGWWRRWSDRRNGRVDGKRGHPPIIKGTVVDTPTARVLREQMLDRVAGERLLFEEATKPMRRRLAVLLTAQNQAHEYASRHQKVLSEIGDQPSGAQLTERKPGERHTHGDVVADRRTRTHRARRVATQNQLDSACKEGDQAGQEIADLAEAVANEHRALQERCRRLLALALRRFGTYQRQLVRRHPDGPELLAVLKVLAPELPETVTDELTATGVLVAAAPHTETPDEAQADAASSESPDIPADRTVPTAV